MMHKLNTIVGTITLGAAAIAALAVAAAALAAGSAPAAGSAKDAAVVAAARKFTGTAPTDLVERGRYIVSTSGCNDCHTPHYMEKLGDVPEREWLTGVPVGFQGPWGTTYPANLRLAFADVSEKQWLERARQPMRPPMPWFGLRDMNDDDLRAIYAYVRSAGPAGTAAPAYVPPGRKPETPYFVFVPQNLPPQHAQAK